jgi:hypothetical protein
MVAEPEPLLHWGKKRGKPRIVIVEFHRDAGDF